MGQLNTFSIRNNNGTEGGVLLQSAIGAVGLRCYAAKQAGQWRRFAEQAKARFIVEIPNLEVADD